MFRFAIITDTHIRAPGGDLSSPFPVNEKANGRAAYACELLASEAPEFTIHLGDMVHPLPHMESYSDAVEEAHRIFSPLKPALHFVPGNHDIGDKPSPGMPAKPANETTVVTYEKAFGQGRYSFEHQDVLFVVINSSLINSGTQEESEQREWLEQALLDSTCGRKFLFSHYPPFINTADEIDHYDNYAEPGRSWFLDLCVQSNVEAIFSGHVHHFFFNRYKGIKLHCLPATSFTRQDYAELFSVSPALEYGRDDSGKFSVCTIDVLEAGYRLNLIPTNGKSGTLSESNLQKNKKESFGSAKKPLALVPHLRHAWFESRHLPYNGPMEEFDRKRVRNDYPLLRLIQLGIDVVRIPLSDLHRSEAATRVLDWTALGVRFVVFVIGLPDQASLSLIEQYRESIDALEILSTTQDLSDISPDLPNLLINTPVKVQLSKITTSAEVHNPGEVFAHAVSSGFRMELAGALKGILGTSFVEQNTNRPAIVFQLPWGTDPQQEISKLITQFEGTDYSLVINLRLSDPNPAVGNFDEHRIAGVLGSALRLVDSNDRLSLQCDTFEDVDRGYAPRFGLIDRLGNLRESIVEKL